MRKILTLISLILCFALLLPFPITAHASGVPSVSAKSAILIESETGKVIYSKSSEVRLPMASTTKIMTAIVAIESCEDLTQRFEIDRRAVGAEGSSIYLYEGERLSMEELLYGLMLASANDAALAIAYAVDGSVEKFADRMNKKAHELGLENTSFVNPNGLHDDSHYTTAHDLALITAYALKNETFRAIVGARKRAIPMQNGEGVRMLINHNRMLTLYEGAIGVKTGFTKRAGRCLVSAAERDGMTLIAVTLNAPNDWRDHAALLDFGFSAYERLRFDDASFDIPVISGEKDSIGVRQAIPLSVLISKERGEISRTVLLPRFVWAEVNEGEILGEIIYECNGTVIARSPLVAEGSVKQKKYRSDLFEWIASLFGY